MSSLCPLPEVDILNAVQISTAGIDPRKLKAQYGDRLVFWGGGIDAADPYVR